MGACKGPDWLLAQGSPTTDHMHVSQGSESSLQLLLTESLFRQPAVADEILVGLKTHY